MSAPIVWFSQYFGIDLPQYELPFVDFNLNSDVPLYIDPYAITKDPTELAAECHNSIVSYFQALLNAVRSQDRLRVRYLVRDRFVEPKELHLGVGKRARAGAGLGREQQDLIIEAITRSQALTSGLIQSIQELELHIEGIGPDKISDLVSNIIKGHLAVYTERTCANFGVSTRPVALSAYWNAARSEWDANYFELPTRGVDAYILAPKRFIRRDKDLIDHRYFYQHYVLEVLQREMLSADDSLVQTLKSGQRRVTKKDLSDDPRFPATKEFISRFIQEHPDTIEAYRAELAQRYSPADPALHSGKSSDEDPEILELLAKLKALPTGTKNATAYHRVIRRLVEFSFDWCLENFDVEYEMDDGRGRIDIICDNYANGGLFAELRSDLNATSVPIECKNYSTDLGNDEFNQLSDRLGKKSSRLGFLFCRTIGDPKAMAKHSAQRWLRHEHVILLLDDQTLQQIVQLRLLRDFHGIEACLRRMIRDVKFGTHS